MNIPTNYNNININYKLGFTKKICNKKNKYKLEFKDIKNNISIKLILFSFIELLYIKKDLLKEYNFKFQNFDEYIRNI